MGLHLGVFIKPCCYVFEKMILWAWIYDYPIVQLIEI